MNWPGCSSLTIIVICARILLLTHATPLYNKNFHRQTHSEEVFEPESEIEGYMRNRNIQQHFNQPQANKLSRFLMNTVSKSHDAGYDHQALHSRPSIQSFPSDSLVDTQQYHQSLPSRSRDDAASKSESRGASLLESQQSNRNNDLHREGESEKLKHDDQVREDNEHNGRFIDEQPSVAEALAQSESDVRQETTSITDVYLLAVIAGCLAFAVCGLAVAGVCWFRLHRKLKQASSVDYPAYGVTGPTKERNGSPGDRKLAQSAQMYHYQHQKQQMIASENRLGSDVNTNGVTGSDAESEEECEEGDYTVFECPGLATAGEMEVRNPLFSDQTPIATPATESNQQ